MRKTLTAATLTTIGAIALTGCAPGIDDIGPDTPRAEKDEVFIAWVEDNYMDTFPDMRPSEAPAAVEAMCDLYDQGFGFAAGMVYEDLDPADVPEAQEMVNKGMSLYCPQHVNNAV